MGRHAGWLTAAESLVKGNNFEGVDTIYILEFDFDLKEFLERVKNLTSKKTSIVILYQKELKQMMVSLFVNLMIEIKRFMLLVINNYLVVLIPLPI